MKPIFKSSILLMSLLFVSANINAEVADGLSGEGFKHPAMTEGHAAPGAAMAAPMMQPKGPVVEGKVVEMSTAAGYSYLRLQAAGKTFWVAVTQVDAKVGDVVSYVENVAMDNFTSRSLNKTFDRIIFASSAKVVK